MQLDLMGMKNILALTGDYSGQGFGGQGAPVFDMDSVNLICALTMLNDRSAGAGGDPEGFFTGCAVSPFKQTEGESFAQYAKLCKKIAAGARFVDHPARLRCAKVPGAAQDAGTDMGFVSQPWHRFSADPHHGADHARRTNPRGGGDPTSVGPRSRRNGRTGSGPGAAVERAARLAVMLKGLGYQGVHFGGIHHSFEPVARILDRMEAIAHTGRAYTENFDFPRKRGFYFFENDPPCGSFRKDPRAPLSARSPRIRQGNYGSWRRCTTCSSASTAPLRPGLLSVCAARLDRRPARREACWMRALEDPVKKLFFLPDAAGTAASSTWPFSAPSPSAPSTCATGPAAAATTACVRCTDGSACVWYRAYNRLAIGRPDRGDDPQGVSRPACGSWTEPRPGSIFTLAGTTRAPSRPSPAIAARRPVPWMRSSIGDQTAAFI